ncbi:Hypothetical protein, putative [Bodo saltans]|uniref:Adenylyl cyclase n=1 Tax=Bodo saltans TaxID=75058 RepID=A0A0S4IJA4_BODSA|nr:Hypothetical protein, putative [Bodo saltans]|eukprot:CUE78014.1 Hypothetical protein, putative [Bodo saltans]
MSRQRSALAAARKKSVGLDSAQFVYLVDPQRADPVLREQRERRLHAILKYDSPREILDSMSHTTSAQEEALVTFRAFDDDMVAVHSDASSTSNPVTPRETSISAIVEQQAQIEVTVTSPRKSSRVPSLNFGSDKRSPRPTAEQRRKSLKTILMMPADVLSGLGEIEETLAALGDDKKLLGLEEQAEAVMSARGVRSQNRQRTPQVSQRSTPRVSPLPTLPPVNEPDFDQEITDAIHGGFSAVETASEMMSTIEGTVEALRLDLVGMFDATLGAYLQKQQSVIISAVNAVKKLLADTVVPRWAEKNSTIQSQKDEVAAERRVSLHAKNEVSRLQAAMRKYGIVPAKWGVIAPPSDGCVLLCCDFPMLPSLWERDAAGVRTSVKLMTELERKLIREMKSGYEVSNDGVSFLLAFSNCRAAVDWGLSFQSQLLGLSWPSSLLQLAECQPDAKLTWKGIKARIAVHCGSVTSRFDPETQSFGFVGEGVRVANAMMTYCPEGSMVASNVVLAPIGDLRSLATHGGGYGIAVDVVLEGTNMRITRLVPYALGLRLSAFADASDTFSKTPGHPGFLMHTLRPSDWAHTGAQSTMILSTSSNAPKAVEVDRDADQVCVGSQFALAMEDEEDNLQQLAMCLNLTTLPDKVLRVLKSAESAAFPVVTVFAQIIDANKAFARHQPSLLPTIRSMLKCVRKAVKGLTTGTDISCVGETASLIFASRMEAVTFVDRFLATFYSCTWDKETKTGWALAFPKSQDPTPDVVVGVHCGPLSNFDHPGLNRDVSDCFDALAKANTETFTSMYSSLTVSTVEGGASPLPPSELLLSGYAKNFDVACALASFALPGEAIFSSALLDTCGSAQAKSISFVDLGHHSIQSPKYDGILMCGISSSYHAKHGSPRSNASTVHSTVTAEGCSWPSSHTVQGLIAWVPILHETHAANLRAMNLLRGERSINQMRRPPKPSDVVFVSVEAYVPQIMWTRPKKSLILEALRVFQRCVRGLLTELDDGYEVFADPQCFLLAFSDQLTAFRFSSLIQDKLASAFWPPAFIEEFKPHVKRVENSVGALLWSGLKARVAMVTPQRNQPSKSETASTDESFNEVITDTIPGLGMTTYFSRAVRWCVALCSVAAYGQTLIDKTTADNIQSSLSLIDGPTVDWAVSICVPEKATPLRGFQVKSQLLKGRVLECSPSAVFSENAFLSWYTLLHKDDTSIQYVLDAGTAGMLSPQQTGRVSRANSLLPAGMFDQPGLAIVESIAPSEHTGTPDQFTRSTTELYSGVSPSVAPLPISTHVTPRQRRFSSVTPQKFTEDTVDSAEYQELLDEFNKVHRVMKGLFEIEQEFVRTYIFKEQMRHFRSEDEFLKIIVQACRDGGVKWAGSHDNKHHDKGFAALCGSATAPDAVLTRHTSTGGETSRQRTPTTRLRPSDVTASIASLFCQFHMLVTRGTRIRRKSSLSVDTMGSVNPADSMRLRSRSITASDAPQFTPRQGTRIQATVGDLGAKAVETSESDNEENQED